MLRFESFWPLLRASDECEGSVVEQLVEEGVEDVGGNGGSVVVGSVDGLVYRNTVDGGVGETLLESASLVIEGDGGTKVGKGDVDGAGVEGAEVALASFTKDLLEMFKDV